MLAGLRAMGRDNARTPMQCDASELAGFTTGTPWLALNPNHDGAYHILGRWNAEIMRISGISRFFAKNFLGAGVFNQASWAKAIYNMEKAAELDPGRIYHRLELAEIYADRSRVKDATAQLRVIDSLPVREVMDSVYKRDAAALRRKLAKR